ncbi:MAG TPA: hypothetical protein VJI98_05220 [Candidatus Nanoarchaeia archaeon]|nr:hypothetical protein [Candidatus Nanoarchaeia archaeon]
MKTKLFLPIMLVGLLILTACGTQNQNAGQGGGAYIGGTTGLVASFEPLSIIENSIYTVFDSEDFPIEIVLTNKGEEDIVPGKVNLKLLGPAKTDFRNIPSWELRNVNTINKISQFNPEGGEEVISFTPGARALYTAPVTGYNDITWNLEYSYEYKTSSIVSDVCFKGDLTRTEVCDVKAARTTAVSAAPISITNVQEDTGGKGIITLSFDVLNAGKGEVTIPGKEFDNRFGQISYTIDEPTKWECKSGGREGEARLIGGRATVICRLKAPLGEDDLYVKNVRFTLNYVYKEILQEKLRVKESVK